MRSECYNCKKTFSGQGLIVTLHGQERTYCADCLWKLQKELSQKKTCENCGHFDEESCGKTRRKLVPVKAGFSTYFVDAETCRDFSTETKASKKKKTQLSESQKEVAALIEALAKNGQTLTAYCTHCGAPLKIGAKSPQLPTTCQRCMGDLEIVDFAAFIKQHQP